LFLAVLLELFDGSLMAVRVVQATLGAIGCVLTARVASRVWSGEAFAPAGLLQAACAPLIFLDTAILAEPLMIVLLTLALDVATRAERRPSRWFVAGAVLGAASIVRPTALAVTVAFAAALVWRWQQRRVARATVVALTLGTLMVIAPVLLQNWRVTGVPLIQAYGGMNFYLGNSPSGDGAARARPGGRWDELEGEASRAGARRNEQDAHFVTRTWREVRSNPVGYVRVLTSKAIWATQAEELRDTHSYYFFRDAVPGWRWLPGFGLVLGLASTAVFMRTRLADPALWLFAYLVGTTATLVLLVVGLRYRAPLVPALCVLAGGALAVLAEWVRARVWRRVGMAAAMFAAVFVVSHIRSDPASRNFAEEWAFTGLALLAQGNAGEAEAAFRRGVTIDPQSSFAWDGLALALQRQGARADARAAFERAVGVNPANATAWYHLGLWFDAQRDHEAAVGAYRRSLSIAPARSDVIYALASALMVSGAYAEAETLFRSVAERGEGRAYIGLAVIALQRRDLRAAEDALARAQRLGADPERVRALHGAITQLRLSKP
jgi:Flp pilus assembly protein TadD